MSSDIYAKPDLSKKARYSRKEQGDRGDWEQREVEIYESADDFRHSYATFQSEEGGPQTQNRHPVLKTSFRNATVGLTVLCLLMLAGIIILSTCYILVTLDKEQLQNRSNKLRNDYNLLQAQLSDMMANSSQLQSRYNILTENHSQLQAKLSVMTVNNNQLQRTITQLRDKINEKWCPEGWTRSGCSCYFISTERKTWFQSRRDCQDKGADLVIINSAEEQKLISDLNKRGESWIGLRVIYKQPTGEYEWEWVDGSQLTERHWAAGWSNPRYNYYAVCCDSDGKWTQTYYYEYRTWICEK